MKRSAIALALFLMTAIGIAQAQNSGVASQASSSLAPMQREMLKLPGQHLCGNAVTNVSCDELERAEKNNYRAKPETSPTVAAWTPPRYAGDAISPWTRFADSAQGTGWFAFVRTRNPHVAGIVVKTAYKGLNGHFTGMDILNGQVLCGASGAAPDYIQEADIMMFNASGDRLVPVGNSGFASSVALTPGTNLAEIVQRTCKLLAVRPVSSYVASAPTAMAGECSIPSPSYPIEAMRMGHQGVVKVNFTVGANGHPYDLSAAPSLGAPELDRAAIVAVAKGVCNVPQGTRMARAVTFHLQGSM